MMSLSISHQGHGLMNSTTEHIILYTDIFICFVFVAFDEGTKDFFY